MVVSRALASISFHYLQQLATSRIHFATSIQQKSLIVVESIVRNLEESTLFKVCGGHMRFLAHSH